MREQAMMKCGCVAQGVLSAKGGVKFEPPIPACITHDCYEVAPDAPDLAGRIAQCAYRPTGHAPKPSTLDLAFFVFRGEGSPKATDTCKCGAIRLVHYPRWRCQIKVARRWYKIERDESVMSREFHAPAELAKGAAEREAEFFRSQKHCKDTAVFSADVIDMREINSPVKCKAFIPHGAYEFDEYYCGCHGWD